jgi:hypothetical protein
MISSDADDTDLCDGVGPGAKSTPVTLGARAGISVDQQLPSPLEDEKRAMFVDRFEAIMVRMEEERKREAKEARELERKEDVKRFDRWNDMLSGRLSVAGKTGKAGEETGARSTDGKKVLKREVVVAGTCKTGVKGRLKLLRTGGEKMCRTGGVRVLRAGGEKVWRTGEAKVVRTDGEKVWRTGEVKVLRESGEKMASELKAVRGRGFPWLPEDGAVAFVAGRSDHPWRPGDCAVTFAEGRSDLPWRPGDCAGVTAVEKSGYPWRPGEGHHIFVILL